jgi:uncharacterized protein YndB with AHSA1/START domain
MSVDTLQLTHIPTVKVGMLIHRPPNEVFQAFVDPAITTKFWFTKSSGKMTPGADIQWDWEMYGVLTKRVSWNRLRLLFTGPARSAAETKTTTRAPGGPGRSPVGQRR